MPSSDYEIRVVGILPPEALLDFEGLIAVREPVEAGQLLGEEGRVAAGQHEHARAQLELPRAPSGDGQPDHGVGRRARHPHQASRRGPLAALPPPSAGP